jgi:hypothetical protein
VGEGGRRLPDCRAGQRRGVLCASGARISAGMVTFKVFPSESVPRARKSAENAPHPEWEPRFSPWRHGGWYVTNVRYRSGAVGCVSRNYPDGKWRIVCDTRDGEFTYPTRVAAAVAERELASR